MKLNHWKTVLPIAFAMLMVSDVALAAGEEWMGYAGLGAGFAIGLGALGGGIGQGMAARGMYESVARNPQASGKLNAPFYVGMALIESLVIYCLVIAFFLQGKVG